MKKKLKQLKIIRDIKNLFEHEGEQENYYKPVRVSNFWSKNYIECKLMVIKIKHYQLKNILIKSDHI